MQQFAPPQQQGFTPPQQQGFAPSQQQGFQPPQQQGFPPPQQQGFQPPAAPSNPPANPYAPPGGNPYAPQGAPNAYGAPPNAYAPGAAPGYGAQQPPYSPHPSAPPAGTMPAPAKKSSKGLVIGLAVAAVAVAGGVVAFVMLRGGGAAGGGSRADVVKSTLAALEDGDVDQLMKLTDLPGLHDKVVDCSGKTKPREGTGDDDKELTDKDKDERDVKKQLDKRRKEYEELAPRAKGAKIELVEIVTKEPPAPTDDEKKAEDSEGTILKTGERLMKGCVAKVPMRIHLAKLKLKVTPKGEKVIEQDSEIMLLQVGTGFYLGGPPMVSLGTGALEKELGAVRDKVCACKDAACAEKLKEEFKESPRRKEIKKEIKALSDGDKQKIDAIEDEIKACESKLEGGDQIAAMTQFKDKICACNDKACADKVTQEMSVWGNSHQDSKLSQEDMKRAAEIGDEIGKCIAKLYSTATGTGIGATIAAAGGGDDFAEVEGIPAACEDYRQTILHLSNCSKFPEASRKALVDGWKAMTDAWKNINLKTMPPEAIKAMEDGCRQGVEALKQAGQTMGC